MSQTSSNTFAVSIRSNIVGALPAWVPPPGKFANLGTSTMNSVKPAGWPTGDAGGPFELWSGGVYASDFSNLGAFVVHGSGHFNPGQPLYGGVWCYDLDDLTWKGRNVPPVPIYEDVPGGTAYNQFLESTLGNGTAGHTYVPHTYDGLVYQSAAQGGGPNGSLIRVAGHGGLVATRAVHRFDLSSRSNPPTRIVDDIQIASAYPQAAVDTTRNCIWTLSGSGAGLLKKISLPGYTVTAFNTGYSSYGDNALIYIPAPYDCLVSFGRSGDANIGLFLGVRVSKIVNNVPQPWVFLPSLSGAPGTPAPPNAPNDARCGGVWSTLLNCIVAYEAAGSYKVHKLIPPAPANVTTDTWQWQYETLTGVGGAIPSNHGHTPNGAYSRFMEVPKARCFIWCDSIHQVPQAWRLTGM